MFYDQSSELYAISKHFHIMFYEFIKSNMKMADKISIKYFSDDRKSIVVIGNEAIWGFRVQPDEIFMVQSAEIRPVFTLECYEYDAHYDRLHHLLFNRSSFISNEAVSKVGYVSYDIHDPHSNFTDVIIKLFKHFWNTLNKKAGYPTNAIFNDMKPNLKFHDTF